MHLRLFRNRSSLRGSRNDLHRMDNPLIKTICLNIIIYKPLSSENFANVIFFLQVLMAFDSQQKCRLSVF